MDTDSVSRRINIVMVALLLVGISSTGVAITVGYHVGGTMVDALYVLLAQLFFAMLLISVRHEHPRERKFYHFTLSMVASTWLLAIEAFHGIGVVMLSASMLTAYTYGYINLKNKTGILLSMYCYFLFLMDVLQYPFLEKLLLSLIYLIVASILPLIVVFIINGGANESRRTRSFDTTHHEATG